jgi:hypothetical protein
MSFFQAIAITSAALAVLAGAWDAWRLRRDQRYSTAVMAITAGGPVLSLCLYILVTNLSLRPIVSLALVAAGLAAGVYAGRLAKLSAVDAGGKVRLVGASWLPLPASLCVAALQASAAADSMTGEILSLAALEAAVAFGVASAVVLAWRRSTFGRARRSQAVPGTPAGPGWGQRPDA